MTMEAEDAVRSMPDYVLALFKEAQEQVDVLLPGTPGHDMWTGRRDALDSVLLEMGVDR